MCSRHGAHKVAEEFGVGAARAHLQHADAPFHQGDVVAAAAAEQGAQAHRERLDLAGQQLRFDVLQPINGS